MQEDEDKAFIFQNLDHVLHNASSDARPTSDFG